MHEEPSHGSFMVLLILLLSAGFAHWIIMFLLERVLPVVPEFYLR